MVLMFMDNSTVEAEVLKVNASSLGLFNQLVTTKGLEIKHRCLLHVIHCAGTKMISQGKDGVSRGELKKGC